MTKKTLGLVIALGTFVWLLVGWALSNILYDWFVQFLKTTLGIDEAELVAKYSGFVPALLLAWGAVYLAYMVGQSEGRKNVTAIAAPVDHKDTWPRLSNADRASLRKLLLNVKAEIHIFHTSTTDCTRLATDFQGFFKTLDWKVHPLGGSIGIAPGIDIQTIPDETSLASGREWRAVKEKSGANALIEALQRTGFPVTYHERGGSYNDFSINMFIGVRPE
jgi:hypothetical protein